MKMMNDIAAVETVQAGEQAIIGPRGARFGLNMYTGLAFLVMYMPMEDFLLKFLPVSDSIFTALHFFSEMMIYGLFAILLIVKLGKREKLARTAVEAPLMMFLVVAFASMLWNHVSLFDTAVQLRPVIRYIILFYIVVNVSLTQHQILMLIRLMLLSGALQIVFSMMQVVGGDPVRNIFMPRELGGVGDISVHNSTLLSKHGREQGSVYGSMGDTVILGDFMIIVTAVFLAMIRHVNWSTIIAFMLVGLTVGLSYSSGALLCYMGLTVVWAWFSMGGGKTILLSALGVFGLALMVVGGSFGFHNSIKQQQSFIDDFMGIFTMKYIEHSETNRLGALIGVLPTALMTNPFIGLGPDQDTTIDTLNSSRNNVMLKDMDKAGFEDVYWVAWVAFYGLTGLFALVWLYWRLLKQGMRQIYYSHSLLSRQLGMMTVMLILSTTVILFINRAIEFRPYGFYFWMIVGLLFANMEFLKRQHLKEQQSV